MEELIKTHDIDNTNCMVYPYNLHEDLNSLLHRLFSQQFRTLVQICIQSTKWVTDGNNEKRQPVHPDIRLTKIVASSFNATGKEWPRQFLFADVWQFFAMLRRALKFSDGSKFRFAPFYGVTCIVHASAIEIQTSVHVHHLHQQKDQLIKKTEQACLIIQFCSQWLHLLYINISRIYNDK